MKMMQQNRLLILITLMISLLIFSGCAGDGGIKLDPEPEPPAESVFSESLVDDYKEVISAGGVVVHYIDVGQGDSTLIQLSTGENILIDAGEVDKGEVVFDYLRANGVDNINYLIATHPHSDHIGGMKYIVDNLAIEQIYMPRVVHTTQTYENLLLAIKDKGLKIREAKAGVRLETDDIFEISFLAPNRSDYDNLNEYSVVTQLKYSEHVFLFTGDAESVSGQEVLDSGYDIRADVLDVPHHGSNNSLLSAEFLHKVSPQIAIISLGRDNRYGHPHAEVLDRLNNIGANILRTDIDGNIVIVSDGDNFIINKNINISNQGADPINEKEKYIGNKNSKVFHRMDCSSLPIEKNRHHFNSRQKAIDEGYRPCGQCQP